MNYYFDAFKRYADFAGRSSVKQYWMFVLINLIVSFVVGAIGGGIDATVNSIWIGLILNIAYGLATLIPSIAIGIRRLHDIGKSGWWTLIALIPIIGVIILIVFNVEKGQPGPNAYGADPEGGVAMTPAPVA
jgi:uncharacterized membrane protein YhaH (DUF805 family)